MANGKILGSNVRKSKNILDIYSDFTAIMSKGLYLCGAGSILKT
jgi:hypothetical protein